MSQISRRDFLKFAGMTTASVLAARPLNFLDSAGVEGHNIIIILCDSFSAKHLSLYGYPRQTTPNIDAFAERSTVFHNHYSGGNFTTTGTASMLTGMIPWKHRALNLGGLVRSEFIGSNPYTLLGSDYFRFAFSQNPFPDRLIGQYYKDIDRFLPPSAYSLQKDFSPLSVFDNDRVLASIAIEDFLLPIQDSTVAGTALFGYINKNRILTNPRNQKITYRHGIPEVLESWSLISYLNEEIYSGLYSELIHLASKASPYFAYFHLYSPHFPYRPRNDFLKLFRDDGFKPVSKPIHPLASGVDEGSLISLSALYDKQIVQVDDEFGRLIAKLNKDGILENSYLIFTSDHGELFERGFFGHGDEFMYEPVLHIPLIIRAPGQAKRDDIFALTSNIDILPTILSIAGKSPAPDVDGQVLPGLGGQTDEDRLIFSIYAGKNPAFGRLEKAVISMRRREYKLIAYLGYDNFDHVFELYDLEKDPDELDNLVSKDAKTLAAMKDKLFAHLNDANRL
ncbi:MAG: sulfatase-like hydrolase/transferase [Anaerolineales bacterium]|nr:sulfatase-like hydrolase/transferase [Anaerolineales bacterium]